MVMVEQKKVKKGNPWLDYVKKIRAMPESKGLKQAEIIKKARETYVPLTKGEK